jgi:hypothetical protein
MEKGNNHTFHVIARNEAIQNKKVIDKKNSSKHNINIDI